MIEVQAKYFKDLSNDELHDLLQLRSEVFVVEQNCVYQDVDGKDKQALHVLGFKNDKIVAYTRIFKPGDYYTEASIGRVVVIKSERKYKYGYDIMKASLDVIKEQFNTSSVTLSAQVYLKHFYNNLGFKEVGEEYLEDDIPHIKMMKH